MSTNTPLLATEDLTKAFGELVAVDHMNLVIEEDVVSAVIGPNGAGKSTLFNLICGLLPVDSGHVLFKGEDITGASPHDISRRGIGRSFQIVDVFEGITVRENVRLATQFHDDNREAKWRHAESLGDPFERANGILADVGLAEVADDRADTLSHGDRRRLDVAMTIATEPELILLDEPTAGLGKEGSDELISIIERLTDERDITMVLVEHDLEIVWDVADVINVMHNGALLARGSPEEIQEDPEVQSAYLGTSDDE